MSRAGKAPVAVGVIGAGALGKEHIRRLCTAVGGVRVALVAEPGAQNAAFVREKYGIETVDDGAALIESPDVEAVVIASPDATHEALTLACIEAGKPVFCEKPLAATAEGCRRVMEAEQAAGRRLVQVGFMRRYDKHHRELHSLLRSGAIGAPLLVHAVHRNPTMAPGYTSAMQISNAAIHELDALRFLLGEEVVRCRVEKARKSTHAGLVQDPLLVLMETQSGTLIDLEVFTHCRYGFDIGMEVVGEEGTAALPPSASVTKKHDGARTLREYDFWQERYFQAYDLEFQDWAAHLPGEPAGPSAWDAAASALLADACIRSLESGREEAVDIPKPPAFYRQALAQKAP